MQENQYTRDERRKYSRLQTRLDTLWDSLILTVDLLTITSKLFWEFFQLFVTKKPRLNDTETDNILFFLRLWEKELIHSYYSDKILRLQMISIFFKRVCDS